MRSRDLALRFSDSRPGYELVGFVPVAIPLYRLELSLVTLERKRIPPVTEFVLRAIDADVRDLPDIQKLLGLTRGMVNETLATLLRGDYLAPERNPQGGSSISLTSKGEHALADAVSVTAEVRDAELDFDALLGEPVPFAMGFLEPRDLDRARLRDLPRSPAARDLSPDAIDIGALSRLGRVYDVPRDAPHDILTIQRIKRRRRLFKEATALLYIGANQEFHVALVVDDALSTAHEEAFARAGLAKQFGIDSSEGVSPITRVLNATIGDQASAWDEQGDARSRANRRRRQRAEMSDREGFASTDDSVSAEAEEETAYERPIELLESFDLDTILSRAVESAQERVLILSERLSQGTISEAWISAVGRALRNGVHIFIGWGLKDHRQSHSECDREAIDRLSKLETVQDRLTVRYLENEVSNTLIVDQSVMVITGHEWLASEGMPARTLQDQRGLSIRLEAAVDAEFARLREMFEDGLPTTELRLPGPAVGRRGDSPIDKSG